MTGEPALSVLLPFQDFNTGFYEAVDSILLQRFTDFELLLVLNRETGWTPHEKSSLTDPRINFLHQSLQGIAQALNRGLEEARGEFIGRMDADDISLPTRFEKQVAFLRKNTGVAAVACQTQFESSLPSKGYEQYVDWQNGLLTPEEHALARFRESPLAHPSICFRRSLIQTYGPYSTEAVPEDYELWLRWMDGGERIAKLPEALLVWKDSPERLSRRHPNYSDEAFFRVKARYLLRYLEGKKVLVCGSSGQARQRAMHLLEGGLGIATWTDIHPKENLPFPYIEPAKIPGPGTYVILSLIAQEGTREKVLGFFEEKGYREGIDFFQGA